jgi:hypothetical protein
MLSGREVVWGPDDEISLSAKHKWVVYITFWCPLGSSVTILRSSCWYEFVGLGAGVSDFLRHDMFLWRSCLGVFLEARPMWIGLIFCVGWWSWVFYAGVVSCLRRSLTPAPKPPNSYQQLLQRIVAALLNGHQNVIYTTNLCLADNEISSSGPHTTSLPLNISWANWNPDDGKSRNMSFWIKSKFF